MNLLDTCAIIKGKEPNKSIYKESEPEIAKLSEKELSDYTGLYANPMFVLEVGIEQNNLTTVIQGKQYILTPLKDGSFLPQIVLPENKLHTLNNTRIEFENIENNSVFIFHNLANDSRQILGTKFYPQEINPLWKNRIGTYQLAEANEFDFPFLATFELAIENGTLVLKLTEEYEGSVNWQPAISIKDDNTAFPLGLGRHRGSTLLFESEHGKEILWFSGYKLVRREN
jgi:hypothetical protein